MITSLIAGLVTLLFTTLLTIAGVGAAFILIPVFVALGIDIHVAMATALLLNAIAMIFASIRFIRAKLVLWKVAIPILIVATALSPLGAWVSQGLDRNVLLWGFVGFLLFAALMMLFYQPKEKDTESSRTKQIVFGVSIGAFAGFLGGLLGVGGGNFIVPVLVWLGINPKKASATTSFIVIFSSLSGFIGATLASMGYSLLGFTSVGSALDAILGAWLIMSYSLLGFTAVGSALGAVLGAWLMTEKLKRRQVKIIIGLVLIAVAAKVAWGLVF